MSVAHKAKLSSRTGTGVDARAETLEVPARVRREVVERDAGLCRVCGSWGGDGLALHHVRYRSEGGLHVAENLVSVHWMYAPRCHEVVHANKGRWQDLLLEVAAGPPNITALQLLRWRRDDA